MKKKAAPKSSTFNNLAQSLDPWFERLASMPRAHRMGIFMIVVGLFAAGFYYLSYTPKTQKIERLETRLYKLQSEIARSRRMAAELEQSRADLDSEIARFKVVMQALPEKKEIPSLLASISQTGQSAGLEFLLFQPKPEQEKDFYAEIPVDMQVQGNYHNVARFFEMVARLSRVVNIREISMTPSKEGDTLTTSCTAVTFKFLEQSAAEASDDDKNKKGGRKRAGK